MTAPGRKPEPVAVSDALAGVGIGAVVVGIGAVVGRIVDGRSRRWRGRGAAFGAAVTIPVALPYARAVARAAPYHGPRGARRLAVDLTWSALNTWAGAIYFGSHLVAGHRLDEVRSRGTGSLWVTEGALPGYATTIGIVKAGATEAVDAHEMVHVFQARLFGPLYLPTVALNYVVATVVPYWLPYHDRSRWPISGFASYFLNGVYPNVWNEAWAYRATDPHPGVQEHEPPD